MKTAFNHSNAPAKRGGESLYKVLKPYSKLVFLNLIKSFKRYYLGIWLIKLPFYAIFSESKAQKWREKKAIRYTNFKNAKKQFFVFRKLIPQSKLWLDSPEFKAQYIDTNHPYPPLLNPASIDYESISAELAWELNLPLPPKYNMIFLSNGASAIGATLTFLTACGVSVGGLDYTPKASYLRLYDFLSKNTSAFITLPLFAEAIVPYPEFYDDFKMRQSPNYDDSIKLIDSVTRKVPLLYVVRDPIGRMRTIINHINNLPITPIMKRFNLTVDYENLFVKSTYFGKVAKPSFVGLDDYNEVAFLYTRLLSDSLFDALGDKVSEIHCVEFNDLNADNAFALFETLAKKFGFTMPKSTQRAIFSNRCSFCNGGAITTFPITLYVHPSDIDAKCQNLDSLRKNGGFSIIITTQTDFSLKNQGNFIDISNEIESNIIIDETKIAMLITKDEFAELKSNTKLFNATKKYLKGYIRAAKENVAMIRSNLIKDSDIVEYLRTHRDKRVFYKNIFDNELRFIKAHYPHFVDKWSAYNAFNQICVESQNSL